MNDLSQLAQTNTPTADLMEEALTLAHEKNLSACAACYAVLAKKLELPLITADEPLAKAVDWVVRVGTIEV